MTPLEDQVKVAEARGRLIPQTPPEAHRGVRVPLTPVRHLSNWHCQAVSNISL